MDASAEEEGRRALRAARLTLDQLIGVLRAEEAARLSETTQLAYAEAEARGSDWLEVTEALQTRLLREAGVSSGRMAAALYVLRTATQLFTSNGELCSIPLYVRHNRAELGALRDGDALPDVTLYNLDESAVSVRHACGDAPVLLISGSWT